MPTWDAATTTLTGNATATDTSGAAAWFEPNAPISSLTFTFTRRAGVPGVSDLVRGDHPHDLGHGDRLDRGRAGGRHDRASDRIRRLRPRGETTTSADGAYAFSDVLATDGYRVEITPPAGKISDEPTRTVDVTIADVTADFAVRDIVPVPVSARRGTSTAIRSQERR